MFGLAILDSMGVPIIGGVDALLVAIAAVSPAQAYLAAFFAIAGSLIGSLLLFQLARKGGKVMLAKYTVSGRGLKLRHWFDRYGLLTVFVPAVSPLPLPMKIPVFCAGALGVSVERFGASVLAARMIRYLALAFLGREFGPETLPFIKAHWQVAAAIVVVLCVLSLLLLKTIDHDPVAPGHEPMAASDSTRS